MTPPLPIKWGSGHPLPPSPSQFKFGSCGCSAECAVMSRSSSSLGFSFTSCFKGTNEEIFRAVCRVNVSEGVHKAQVRECPRGGRRDEQSASTALWPRNSPNTALSNGNNWERQMKWWKMKGSAEIRPNINSTKINSAWLLWLIQKQLFPSELRSEGRWNRTSLLCAFRSHCNSGWQWEEVFKGKYWRLQLYLLHCITGNVTSPARMCNCS